MSKNVVQLETELTEALSHVDEVREQIREGATDWALVIYSVDGEVYCRHWCDDLTPARSREIQGALWGVRDYLAEVGEGDS